MTDLGKSHAYRTEYDGHTEGDRVLIAVCEAGSDSDHGVGGADSSSVPMIAVPGELIVSTTEVPGEVIARSDYGANDHGVGGADRNAQGKAATRTDRGAGGDDFSESAKPKRRFNFKRLFAQLISALIVVIGVTFISFALAYISPTDPATQYFSNRGVAPTEAQLAQVRAEMGLDKPFLQQYADWMIGLLHGDMGESYRSGRSVFQSLASALPYTLALAASVMVLTLLLAVPAGLWSAYRKDGVFDKCVRVLSYAFCSLPAFFVALVLLYVLSVQLHLLPVTSRDAVGIIMPTLAIALPLSAWFVRQVRTIGLEQMNAGYVDGLRARHVPESMILFKHVLRNSLVPILALVGVSMGSLLGGSAIVESIFGWPGVGNLSVSAISMRDYTVVQGYALLMAIVYLLVNWGVEFACRFVDPRIREGRGRR